MKKPFAYITAVWKGGEFTVIDQAAVYCRKVYEAGFTPICPVLYRRLWPQQLLDRPLRLDCQDGYCS